MAVNNLDWNIVKAQFEEDYTATPSISSVIQKMPEIWQKDNETVIQYISRCAEILLELKSKTDIADMNMQLTLSAEETAAYNGIEAALRARITREIKMKSQELTFNLISGFHLIACFKAEIRAGLMKRDGHLTSIQLIKQEAMKLELIL